MRSLKLMSLIIAAMVVVLPLSAQNSTGYACDDPHFTTVNIHYYVAKGDEGVSLELGLQGNESNISVHGGLTAVMRTVQTKDFEETTIGGMMYIKAGYRVLRIPGKFSIIPEVIGNFDMERGPYPSGAIKFLVPMGQSALSLEPIYGKYGAALQLGFNLII